jgi:glycosyltransferase involved in cell wall biosynthesis
MSSSSTDRPDLSMVFPAHDEEGNLEPLLDAAFELAAKLPQRVEVIVVDDGSRDGTARVVEGRRVREPRLRLVRHDTNRGYGAALRSGLRAARGRLVFFSDADRQFSLLELETLLAHADRYEVVVGYRAPRADPWLRRLIAALGGAAARALFGVRVRDIDCAFKLFHREVLEGMRIASDGIFVNTEVLARAARAGFRIHEVPVSHRPRRRGRQTGARPRVIARMLREGARLYPELRRRSS